MNTKQILICFFAAAGTLLADQIRLQDGGLFNGKIQSISESHINIETDFAGTLTVDRSKIDGFSVDNPLFVRLEDGSVHSGPVSSPEAGTVVIAGPEDSLQKPLASIRQGWLEPEDDPKAIAARQAEKQIEQKAARKWKYQTLANFSAKSGNSDERQFGAGVTVRLVGDQDELRLNGKYNSRESNGQKSSDRRKGGARYTSYFSDPWGWYVRQEFEEDRFKNLKLRSISALGFSYRQKHEKQEKMELSLGITYRHESYMDQTEESSNIGLDLGLNHFFGGEGRFTLHNQLSIVPSVEDRANYLISHESYMDVPFADSKRWKIRFGIENDYNSQPTGNRVALDSRYYSSFVADWN